MPTFSTQGDTHFVSIITGPSHVRLGLRFADEPVETPIFVRRPAVGGCDHGPLDEAEILAAVKSGCTAIGHAVFVAEIVYVANDSPRYDMYAYCAKLLAQRFVDG